MAVMTIKETSRDGVRKFELNRTQVRQIEERTGLKFIVIYTILNMGKPVEHSGIRWQIVRP